MNKVRTKSTETVVNDFMAVMSISLEQSNKGTPFYNATYHRISFCKQSFLAASFTV